MQQVNMNLGKTDLQGQGIEVIIREIENEEIEQVTADVLLLIVNALKQAGAEAISINGHRIISASVIVDIGNTEFIKVNGKRIPDNTYVIKAIGNQDYLRGAVLGKGGHVDELKELGHETMVEASNRVFVESYGEEITSKYID